jgi:hypothetical protein
VSNKRWGRPNGGAHDNDWSPQLSPEGQRTPRIREGIEAKYRRKLHRSPKGEQFQKIPAALSRSPVWLALCQDPWAMAMFWCLVDIRHHDGGNQDDGLVCSRRYFKKWCEGGGDQRAAKALAVLDQLGLVDVVDQGMIANNPRYSRPRRYALTIGPFDGKPPSHRWETPECQDRARVLLAEKREAAAARSARFRPAGGRSGGTATTSLRPVAGSGRSDRNDHASPSPALGSRSARRGRTALEGLQ